MFAAFETRASAIRFSAALAFCMALPVVLRVGGLPPRADVYSGINERAGPYIFTRHQLFDSSSDIDIAFVGSSVLRMALDVDYVQERMAARFGDSVNVRGFFFIFPGLDLQYVMIRDLLEHRKVKMLVVTFSGQHKLPDGPHVQLHRFVRFGDYPDAFKALPVRDRITMYASHVLGAPRQLLTAVRPNIVASPAKWRSLQHYDTVSVLTGSPAPAVALTDSTRDEFVLSDATLSARQRYFATAIADLAERHRVPLVILNVPNPEDFDSKRIWERADWRGILAGPPTVVGFRAADLFSADRSRDRFFVDPIHLNADGQASVTRSLVPFLLDHYAAINRR